MGLEWLARVGRSFKRTWDRGREDMGEALLFDRDVCTSFPAVAASPVSVGGKLEMGKEYVVRMGDHGKLTLQDGGRVVAVAQAPSALAEVLEARGSVGVATVRHVHPLSGRADVTIE